MSIDTTKECIYTALMLLMEQKSYDKITVTDVTKKAGVSRMSFYRHFDSKDDVLFKSAEECFKKVESSEEFQNSLKSEEFLISYLTTIRDSKTVLRSLDRAGKIDMLFPILLKYNTLIAEKYIKVNTDSKESQLILIYHTGGIFQLIKHWLRTDFKASVTDIIKTLNRISEC